MDLLAAFLEFDKSNHFQLAGRRLLLAVSGGLDSVVLAQLCREAGFTFAIAHCNFGLRGAESDGDAAFVRELARKLDVPFFQKDFATETYTAEHKVSIQVAARELRYQWFAELLHQAWLADSRLPIADSRILTAHHLDDSIETLLLNFFKGTGITGLAGIPAQNGNVLRPLLFASRAEIREWAEAKGVAWREDSSNSDAKYTRNALRHEVLPLLEKLFPQVRQNLARNLRRFGGAAAIYRATVDLQVKKLLEWKEGEARVPVRKLLQATPLDTILFELTRPFGFTPAQTDGLARLLQSEPGRFIDSPSHRALRHGAWLLFVALRPAQASMHVLQKGDTSVVLDGQLLAISELDTPPAELSADPAVALLDARHVHFPLLVRRWKPGDYFYPLGMRKKKKLARFFIDAKLSKVARENTWVVESHKRIIWIAGHRIDDRFKITDATRKVLRLTLTELSPGATTAAPGTRSSQG